jgi:serine protease SohB
MMAAVADHIIASPFAIIGSIGVVMTSPNVHRLLQHHLIDVEQVTAGQYKRTLDPFTPNTESARVKTHQDLEVIHEHFKNHIAHHRKKVEIDKVSTGEIWLAMDAINLGLIDKLQSSDDYLLNQIDEATIIEVRDPSKKRGWLAKMGNNITHWLSEKPKVPEAKMPS